MIDAAKIDTTIYISDFAIHQPVTVFTDFLITALCFYFYWKLNRASFLDDSTINWKRFYLLLSLASFIGAFSHGLFAVHEGFGYKSFWLTMQALNVFSVYRAQQATLFSALKNSAKKYYWNLSYHTQLLFFFVAVFVFQNFSVVVIDSIIGLIPIMIIHFIDAKKINTSYWIAYGIVVLCFAAIVNATKFSPHIYFNYLDFSHLIILIQLSVMFIGIKRKAISQTL